MNSAIASRVCLVIHATVLALPCVGAQFTDVTPSVVSITGFTNGVAWGDYDNDGDLDLYAAYSLGQADHLFRNDGGGIFADVTAGPLADPGDGVSAAWADMDNDGDVDLALTNGAGVNRLFRNDGSGVFLDASNGPLLTPGVTLGLAWGDFDNDGRVDLYLAFPVGSSQLLRNVGGGAMVDVTSPVTAGTGLLSVMPTWVDYDDDGDLDLFVTRNGPNILLRNDGAGVLTDATTATIQATGDNTSASWGDYDNDGDLDLFLGRFAGADRLFRNNGGGSFTDVTPGMLAGIGFTYGTSWIDVDNDGDLDLYVQTAFGPNHLYRNDGSGAFSDIGAGEPFWFLGNSTGSAWGDYDNDGDLDLAAATWDDLPDYLFRNDFANGNHWLQVALRGTVSNAAAIGARVKVTTGALTQIREVSGGGGYFSQDSLCQSFGLGGASLVDTIEVRWPSGTIQTIPNVAVDQKLTIVEPMPDADGDGIPDGTDSCPGSSLTATVVIGSCDSGVPNSVLATGCSINDLVSRCAAGATNHGTFESCISQVTNDLKRTGAITGEQKGAITSCAARAEIP